MVALHFIASSLTIIIALLLIIAYFGVDSRLPLSVWI